MKSGSILILSICISLLQSHNLYAQSSCLADNTNFQPFRLCVDTAITQCADQSSVCTWQDGRNFLTYNGVYYKVSEECCAQSGKSKIINCLKRRLRTLRSAKSVLPADAYKKASDELKNLRKAVKQVGQCGVG